jgi:hypothetical protein
MTDWMTAHDAPLMRTATALADLQDTAAFAFLKNRLETPFFLASSQTEALACMQDFNSLLSVYDNATLCLQDLKQSSASTPSFFRVLRKPETFDCTPALAHFSTHNFGLDLSQPHSFWAGFNARMSAFQARLNSFFDICLRVEQRVNALSTGIGLIQTRAKNLGQRIPDVFKATLTSFRLDVRDPLHTVQHLSAAERWLSTWSGQLNTLEDEPPQTQIMFFEAERLVRLLPATEACQTLRDWFDTIVQRHQNPKDRPAVRVGLTHCLAALRAEQTRRLSEKSSASIAPPIHALKLKSVEPAFSVQDGRGLFLSLQAKAKKLGIQNVPFVQMLESTLSTYFSSPQPDVSAIQSTLHQYTLACRVQPS